MSAVWDDVGARARGLATRLFTAGQLETLASARDAAELAVAFRRLGLPLSGEHEMASPAELELAVRRWAASALGILARWAGTRAAALAVIYEDEDRRSLRALLRGARRGAPAGERILGLIPTPGLPERALEELARQPTPARIAALLSAWRNPYGAALLPAARAAEPDAFALDLALNHTFATRALAAARPGGADLVTYARQTIDLENAVTALILTVAGAEIVPAGVFLPGGERVSLAVFEAAVSLREPRSAGARLADAFGRRPVAGPLRHLGGEPARLETELWRARIHELARWTRRVPLSPAPILWFALRLRGQAIDLQRILWGVTLAAPPADLSAALITIP